MWRQSTVPENITKADALSHNDIPRFFLQAPQSIDRMATRIPEQLLTLVVEERRTGCPSTGGSCLPAVSGRLSPTGHTRQEKEISKLLWQDGGYPTTNLRKAVMLFCGFPQAGGSETPNSKSLLVSSKALTNLQ